jgi:CheY-like chemotaxis protein
MYCARSFGSQEPVMRVLIVDDYCSAADLVALLVRLCGHEPVLAYDGFQALDRAAKLKPDIALIDIQMPGMDGYATARRLRDEVGLVSTPIYALSSFEPDPALIESAGMRGYFRKPLVFEQVRQLVGG